MWTSVDAMTLFPTAPSLVNFVDSVIESGNVYISWREVDGVAGKGYGPKPVGRNTSLNLFF